LQFSRNPQDLDGTACDLAEIQMIWIEKLVIQQESK
jgi:hypothetical protein